MAGRSGLTASMWGTSGVTASTPSPTPTPWSAIASLKRTAGDRGWPAGRWKQFLADAGPRFGLKRVGAFAYADNPASVRVLEKNGFAIQETFEEEGRRSFYLVREI